ncbi:hypothetical protein BH11PLA2_BH11PLA2_17990 [soil metagenome]
MKMRYLIFPALITLFLLLAMASFQRVSDRNYAWDYSINHARSVILGCQLYRKHSESGGNFPATLNELLEARFKGQEYLEVPEIDILDWQGKRLRYALLINEQGEQEVYVWTEITVREKTQLCGAKGTIDGSVTLFGLPE